MTIPETFDLDIILKRFVVRYRRSRDEHVFLCQYLSQSTLKGRGINDAYLSQGTRDRQARFVSKKDLTVSELSEEKSC